MDRIECYQQIVESLEAIKKVDRSRVDESAYVMDDLGFESIDVIDFFLQLEKRTRQRIDLSLPIGKERNPDFSIADLLEYLGQARGGKP